MAPLMQEDVDVSLSSQDDAFAAAKAIAAPLHESCTAAPTPKRVWFDPFAEIQETINRKEFSSEEKQITWYSVEEVSSMRAIARNEARLVETGDLVESKDVSIRGLESRTKKGSKKKKIIRMNSFAAVFLELDFQKAQDFYDDEQIAEAYFKYSMPSSISAQQIGKKDESQARRCWRSPTHCYQKETMRGQAESGKRRGSRRSTRSTRTTSGHSRRSIRELQID